MTTHDDLETVYGGRDEGIVARTLRPGEPPPPDAKLRRPHWPRCRKNTRSR